MKLAFPTNNQKTIANHIGLAKGFLIIDTNTGERFYIENPILQKISEINLKKREEGHRRLGTGRVIPPLLAEAGVDALVAREFGEGMIRNLLIEGIKAIQTDSKNIEEFLKEGDIREIEVNEDLLEYGRDFRRGYGQGLRYGRGFGYGMGLGYGRRFGRGLGYGRRFGFRRWEE